MGREVKRKELGDYLREQRLRHGYSLRQMGRMVRLDFTYLGKLEQGLYQYPKPDHLRAIARALEVEPAEVMTLAGYEEAGDLPAMRPYLRAKYHDLPPEVLAQIADYAEFLTARHGEKGGGDDERNTRAA